MLIIFHFPGLLLELENLKTPEKSWNFEKVTGVILVAWHLYAVLYYVRCCRSRTNNYIIYIIIIR